MKDSLLPMEEVIYLLPAPNFKLRPIEKLCDQELQNIVTNHRRRQVTAGGPYPLRAAIVEMLRREGKEFDGRMVTAAILDLVRKSDDGVALYSDLFGLFYPDKPFLGKHCVKLVMKMLAASTSYCLSQCLPLVAASVARKRDRKKSAKAIANLFGVAKLVEPWLVETPEDFAIRQTRQTHALVFANVRTIN